MIFSLLLSLILFFSVPLFNEPQNFSPSYNTTLEINTSSNCMVWKNRLGLKESIHTKEIKQVCALDKAGWLLPSPIPSFR